MKDLKKIIIGIMIIIVCSLISLWTAQGSEIISPVPVSDKSVEVKKITEKKKEKGEKYYFYYLRAQEVQSQPFFFSGVMKAEKDETPDKVFEKVLISNQKSFSRSVVIIEFHRLE